MSIVFNGTNHELRSQDFGASRPSAYTIAGWFRMDNNAPSSWQILMVLGNLAAYPNDAGDMLMVWGSTVALNPSTVQLNRTGTTYSITSQGSLSGSVWTQRVAVYTGAELGFYENGVLVGSLISGAVTAAAPANWHLSIMHSNDFTQRVPGRAAFLGYWDVALSVDEIKSLGIGFSPGLVRPQSLQYFIPGIRSAANLVGPQPTTANLTFSDNNPRIYV